MKLKSSKRKSTLFILPSTVDFTWRPGSWESWLSKQRRRTDCIASSPLFNKCFLSFPYLKTRIFCCHPKINPWSLFSFLLSNSKWCHLSQNFHQIHPHSPLFFWWLIDEKGKLFCQNFVQMEIWKTFYFPHYSKVPHFVQKNEIQISVTNFLQIRVSRILQIPKFKV